MEKYLFNDGTGGVREVQSAEELLALVQSSADPSKIRIWIFSASQWISYSDFSKGIFTGKKSYNFNVEPAIRSIKAEQLNGNRKPLSLKSNRQWLKRFLFLITLSIVVFLVYNFTKINWEKNGTLDFDASRPANSPLINVDSLIQIIETRKGQPLDKITRTNFRLRNTWPDKINLKITADVFTNRSTNKYSNIELSIDNSTGYNIDNAVVQLAVWSKNKANEYRFSKSDTFRFANIGYVLPMKRRIQDSYLGDSISVSFFSIRSRALNFYYSSDKQSNYGNNNDRWYCRE